MGVSFCCPHCKTTYLGVWFMNPLDGGLPAAPDCEPLSRWQRTGDTFDTLSLTPSVDASQDGHWHGWIIHGEIR